MEIQTREDGSLASFILEQDGKRTGVLLTENTLAWLKEGVFGQSYENMYQIFQEELQIDTEVSAWCSSFPTKLKTTAGRITAYRAKSAYIVGSLERNALTLRDETAVDILSSDPEFRWIYRLPDGTELLRVVAPIGDPASACVNGDEAFGTLSKSRSTTSGRSWRSATQNGGSWGRSSARGTSSRTFGSRHTMRRSCILRRSQPCRAGETPISAWVRPLTGSRGRSWTSGKCSLCRRKKSAAAFRSWWGGSTTNPSG